MPNIIEGFKRLASGWSHERYERLEREHLGDAERKTGIYSEENMSEEQQGMGFRGVSELHTSLTSAMARGPRSQDEQQQFAYEREKYRTWPTWAAELDRKLDYIIRKLDERT
jgi:hypothetical protein